MMETFGLKPLTIRLAALHPLPRDLIEELESRQSRLRMFPARSVLVRTGTAFPAAQTLASGWVLKSRSLRDGRRQVLGTLIPGDTIHLAPYSDGIAATDLECVTDVALADIEPLRQRVTQDDPIGEALRLSLKADATAALETMSRLARQSAFERLALLLLDFYRRLRTVKLTDGTTFPLPLTQQMMAESLGLSIVQVNRTLRQMREEGLAEKLQRRVSIPDPDALARLVDEYGLAPTGARSPS